MSREWQDTYDDDSDESPPDSLQESPPSRRREWPDHADEDDDYDQSDGNDDEVPFGEDFYQDRKSPSARFQEPATELDAREKSMIPKAEDTKPPKQEKEPAKKKVDLPSSIQNQDRESLPRDERGRILPHKKAVEISDDSDIESGDETSGKPPPKMYKRRPNILMDRNLWDPQKDIHEQGHSILFIGTPGTGKTTLMLRCIPNDTILFVLLATRGEAYNQWKQLVPTASISILEDIGNQIVMPPGWVPPKESRYVMTTRNAIDVVETRSSDLGDVAVMSATGQSARAMLWLEKLLFMQQATNPESPLTLVLDDVLTPIAHDLSSQASSLVNDINGKITTLRHRRAYIFASAHYLNKIVSFASTFETVIITSRPSKLTPDVQTFINSRLIRNMSYNKFDRLWRQFCESSSEDTEKQRRIPHFAAVLDVTQGLRFVRMVKGHARNDVLADEVVPETHPMSRYLESKDGATVARTRAYFNGETVNREKDRNASLHPTKNSEKSSVIPGSQPIPPCVIQ